jgi:hypothetical protein
VVVTHHWQTRSRFFAAGMLGFAILVQPCQVPAQDQWGDVHLEISCNSGVQPHFDRAVAMLHSYSFREAAKAFIDIARDDPGCGMAYWGLASATMGSLFAGRISPMALGKGWDFTQKAEAIGARTQRERDYVAAAATFYKDTDKIDQSAARLQKYADAEVNHRPALQN